MQSVRQEFSERIVELRTWANDLSSAVLNSGRTGIAREQYARASITVLLMGSFEHYLKELVRQFIGSVNRLRIPFDSLPDNIRYCHLEQGADILKRTVKKEKKKARANQESPDYIESHRVSMQLASVSQRIPYELVWEAFAQTDSNPGVETIKSLLQNLDIKNAWPTIAQNSPDPYRMLHEAVIPGRLEGLLKFNLTNLLEARNRCAHGAINTAPQLSDIFEFLKALDPLSEGLLVTLNNRLMRLQQDNANP